MYTELSESRNMIDDSNNIAYYVAGNRMYSQPTCGKNLYKLYIDLRFEFFVRDPNIES
jgi:hypothetical protein